MREKLGDSADEVMQKLYSHDINRAVIKNAMEIAWEHGRFSISSMR